MALCPAGALGSRDRALLLLGFASSLRRSELAALQLTDIEEVRQGLVVRLGRCKTDQEGVGRELGIHRGLRAATCPVVAWRAWLLERGKWAGPAFAFVDQTGAVVKRGISGDLIAVRIKAACKRAGMDPARYSSHSLRAGMATAAAEGGASDRAILRPDGSQE